MYARTPMPSLYTKALPYLCDTHVIFDTRFALNNEQKTTSMLMQYIMIGT